MTPAKRKGMIEEKIFMALMLISLAVTIGSICLIIGAVVVKGLPSLNLAMITKIPSGGYYLGKEGGVLNAIAGSLYLVTGATILALLFALPIAVFINVNKRRGSKTARAVRFCMDILWGIPSIVYGAFGFSLMIFLGLRACLLAGIITVALLELPILTRAIDEMIMLVPAELKDASYSLGSTRLETALNVVIRQSLPGIIVAILLAFGRGIGDAASVLFTAGYSDNLPTSLFHPAATLPLAIFFQLGTPFPEVQDRAYAAALILTLIIVAFSVVSRLLSARFSRNIIK